MSFLKLYPKKLFNLEKNNQQWNKMFKNMN